jgi:hypothetical protein
MDATDTTIEVLRNIYTEIAGLRDDTNARFGSLEAGVAKLGATAAAGFMALRAGVATTNETLGLILDRLEARMDRLEARGESSDP